MVYLLLVYLVSFIALCLIGFYYVDVDGERINEGNTLRDFLFLNEEYDSIEKLVIYVPLLNSFFLLLIIAVIAIDRIPSFKLFGKIRDLVSKILDIKIR